MLAWQINWHYWLLYPHSPKGEGDILFYLCPSVQDIFRGTFLSNCWWQKSDIWSQASYMYAILWEVFLDLSDSYYLFAEERGYHKWALAHSSSCFNCFIAPTHHYKHTLSSLCICHFLLHTFTASLKLVCHMKRHLTGMIWCPRLKLWRIKQWNFFCVWHQGSHYFQIRGRSDFSFRELTERSGETSGRS